LAGLFNADWFSFTADFDGYDAYVNNRLALLFDMLDAKRELGDDVGDDERFVNLGMFHFVVMPNGSRSYYYILHSDDLQIKLARHRSRLKTTYPVYVHFKSHFLWSSLYGLSDLKDKFALIIEWLEDLLGCTYIGSKINRVDLCYHTDDVPADFTADCFVGRHTVDRTYRTHRLLSGVEIGSRKSQKLFLRAYNKYLEIRQSKKHWFMDIWLNAGLNVLKVWNIEFQIDREFFTGTSIDDRILDTAEDVMDAIPSIWNYLTTEWVTYRVPDNARRTRWSLHPWWQSLKRFEECKKITRQKQVELPTLDAIAPPLVGYMTTAAARIGGSLEDGSFFKKLYALTKEYGVAYNKDFEEVVRNKKKLLDPEGISSA
jgi:hypothetical protein